MYPINNASPERIAVGPVVLIADGTVQTSGVSISVRGQGGASGAGAGTTAYDNGIVEYTPTQAETNFTSFIVVAFKTGCIPACVTVVTSASTTPGNAGLDWGAVINKTTTNALTGTSVLLTNGTGTGQIVLNSGVVDVRLADAVSHGGTLGSSTATLALSRVNITSQTTNTVGLTIAGNGSGAALNATGGATGQGFLIVGGGTSGDGIKVTTTSGHGLNLAPVGTSMHGIFATGGNGGTSDGARFTNGTGGVGFRPSDVSVTNNLSVGGTSTFVGNVGYSGSVSINGSLSIATNFSISGIFNATNASNNITGVTAALTGDLTATMKTSVTTAANAVVLDSANFTAAAENAFADALLDRTNAIETAITPRLGLRYIGAANAGVLSGAATTTVVILGVGVGTTRITATVDANGNRSAVVLS